MILKVNHTTTYRYGQPVSISHTEVHLTPRPSARQTVLLHELTIDPAPDTRAARNDYFGNGVTAFSIHRPHRTLAITATSLVDRQAADPIHPGLTPPWEQVRDEVRRHESNDTFDAFQFIFESPRVKLGPAFASYVAESFAAGRPLLEAARDLCRRIFTDFKYDQGATTVKTPIEEAFESARVYARLRAYHDRLPALARPARAVRQRMHAHQSRLDRRGSLARVGVGVLRELRLAGFRSHQQPDARGRSRYDRMGTRLLRRAAGERRRAGRRRADDQRHGRGYSRELEHQTAFKYSSNARSEISVHESWMWSMN